LYISLFIIFIMREAITKFLDPTNDIAFRRIFGTEKNKDILIHFINDILGLQGKDQIQDITFQPTIQDPEIASKKQSTIDVLCKDANGVQIIVEMQVSPQQGFAKRAQYYAAKAYARQLNKGKKEGARYKDLKAVIFIAICSRAIFKHKKAYLSRHIILDKETYTQDFKDFSFTIVELSKFKIKKIENLSNIIEKWCYFFKYAPKTTESDLAKIIGTDEMIERAYEELNQFNWTEAELNAYEKEEKRLMDNQAAEDYIFNQGIEKGIVEGREKGRAEGKTEAKLELARRLLQDGMPIERVVKLTGLSAKAIEQFK